jgi:2-polyprenyl-6-methoxyphenol hydroxylase-like FAD-dependent oxidoreductase
MYDAIVIGARCAGSPTAMLLSRKGYRVLLLDRAEFPSDTISTHYIHQTGVSLLAAWGLLERIAATGCPPIESMSVDFGPVVLYGTPPPYAGSTAAYLPRRTILDAILVDAAAEAGAEVRQQFTVDSLVWDAGQVVGVRGHTRGGALVEERARIVVGADGQHSLVAKQTDAETYNDVPARSCAYYAYWNGVPVERAELYVRPYQTLIAAPTNDEQVMVINYWPADAFHDIRGDIEGHFDRALDAAPSLAERVRGGQRAERFRGTADLANFYRKPFGPGWALVGDAGYHKDPITAQGISDAFRDAELLSAAIDNGLSGRQPLDDALAGYEQQRNDATMALYAMTCDMATLEPPPPEQQALIGALPGNQEQIDRFLGAVTGTYPIPEFFSPENIDRIMAAAAAG